MIALAMWPINLNVVGLRSFVLKFDSTNLENTLSNINPAINESKMTVNGPIKNENLFI
jgi:hypothetical protein